VLIGKQKLEQNNIIKKKVFFWSVWEFALGLSLLEYFTKYGLYDYCNPIIYFHFIYLNFKKAFQAKMPDLWQQFFSSAWRLYFFNEI